MSAILPGSGYVYAEHYGDGITAFLINGLFIAGTITAIHQENYAVAGIVASRVQVWESDTAWAAHLQVGPPAAG